MADHWFFAWGNNKFGPFTGAEMKDLAAIGRLQPGDTVWKEGVEAGVAASRVKNLFSTQLPVPPVAIPMPVTEMGEAPVSLDRAETPHSQPPPDGEETNLLAGSGAETGLEEVENRPEPLVPAAADSRSEMLPRPNPEKKKALATGATGAVIVSQDGKYVQFRKKCRRCGYEEPSRNNLLIRNGVARQNFFCPKCRKPSAVEIRGKA